MRGILATMTLLLALPASAETQHTWGSAFYPSTITIQPTSVPGAVAEVVFDNKTVHADEHVTFVLDLDGFAVSVEALVGRGMTPDRMAVIPPAGFIAVPQEIDVAEEGVGHGNMSPTASLARALDLVPALRIGAS